MRFAVLALFVLVGSISLARADKIGVVDLDRLYEKGGIARWLDARAKLDAARGTFRAVESPDGTVPIPYSFCEKEPQSKPCQDLKRIQKEGIENAAWRDHETGVLAPIEAEVATALQAFAKARGLDLLLEKTDAMIYVSSNADITAAFIKDFNAKKPVPKPAKRP